MKKNYQKPEIIEEIQLDREVVFAGNGTSGLPEYCKDNPDADGCY